MSCPDRDQLSGYVLGTLPGNLVEAVTKEFGPSNFFQIFDPETKQPLPVFFTSDNLDRPPTARQVPGG